MKDVDVAVQREPDPIQTIKTAGKFRDDPAYVRTIAARNDFVYILSLALAWHMTARPQYGHVLDKYLLAWSQTYKPSFNPIDETWFDHIVDAYSIGYDALSPNTRVAVERFLFDLAQGYLAQMEDHQRDGGAWINNWQSHRIKLVTMIAVSLDDSSLFSRARMAFTRHLSRSFASDGSVVDFWDRDALHYVVYSLEPLLIAAQAAKARGEDWMSIRGRNGISLVDGLNWLVPYAKGEKTHVEFRNTKVEFDRVRKDRGIAEFDNRPWNPEKGKQLFELASLLDSRFVPLASKLQAAPTTRDRICPIVK